MNLVHIDELSKQRRCRSLALSKRRQNQGKRLDTFQGLPSCENLALTREELFCQENGLRRISAIDDQYCAKDSNIFLSRSNPSPINRYQGRDGEIEASHIPFSNEFHEISEKSLDDDSISSLGSSESVSTSVAPRRSIFNQYWSSEKKTRTQQKNLSTSSTENATFTSSCSYETPSSPHRLYHFNEEYTNCEGSANSYEQVIKEVEEGRTVVPSALQLKQCDNVEGHSDDQPTLPKCHTVRRSIFGTFVRYPSFSSQQSYGYSSFPIRKTSSSSALLVNRKRRSCLRSRSLSDCGSHAGNLDCKVQETDLSVSFDPNVSVYEIDKHHDVYTQDGWSKMFH